MSMTPVQWLAAYRQAWIDRDANAAAALFTADATYAEQPYEDAIVGRKGVHDYWSRVTATQSAIEMKFGAPISAGDRCVVEWWTTLANDGVPITLAGCFLLQFDASGQCRSLREYWHFAAGTQQPRRGWGT
jgi:SnoaL-like domain